MYMYAYPKSFIIIFLSKLILVNKIFVIFVINPYTAHVEQKSRQAKIPDEFDKILSQNGKSLYNHKATPSIKATPTN